MNKLPRGEAMLPLLALALSVLMFIAWPLVDMGALWRPLIGMVLLVVSLSGLTAFGLPGRLTRPVLALGGILFLAQVTVAIWPTPTAGIVNNIAAGSFVLLLSAVLLTGVMGPGRVTANRIVGAVVVYLLFALLFALLFDLVERLSPGAFAIGQDLGTAAWTGWRFVYLSVITLSSLGLSDMTPVHPFARSLIMMEAILGQIYTTVLLARLVSLEVAHQLRPPPS
jgi:hypothetical protein